MAGSPSKFLKVAPELYEGPVRLSANWSSLVTDVVFKEAAAVVDVSVEEKEDEEDEEENGCDGTWWKTRSRVSTISGDHNDARQTKKGLRKALYFFDQLGGVHAMRLLRTYVVSITPSESCTRSWTMGVGSIGRLSSSLNPHARHCRGCSTTRRSNILCYEDKEHDRNN